MLPVSLTPSECQHHQIQPLVRMHKGKPVSIRVKCHDCKRTFTPKELGLEFKVEVDKRGKVHIFTRKA